MYPITDYRGVVIDHHPPLKELPDATIIHGDVPASLISWTMFKDCIPKDEWWKVGVGLAGDNQSELIPTEVWDESATLLDEYGKFFRKKDGKDHHYPMPIWKLLSSGINAFCRTYNHTEAFKQLKEAKTPFDILENKEIAAEKMKVRKAVSRAINSTSPIKLAHTNLWIVDSNCSVAGELAIRMYESSHKTTMVLNKRTGTFSVRGVLAYYIKDKLVDTIEAGGHPGFVGGELKEGKTTDDLLEALRGI